MSQMRSFAGHLELRHMILIDFGTVPFGRLGAHSCHVKSYPNLT